jgi:hypothetical protein
MNLLVLSSLVFTTNVLTTMYKEYYIYGCLFSGLTTTSLMYHSHPTMYTRILDKTMVFMVVGYGGNMLYQKSTHDNSCHILGVLGLFLSVLRLYVYGYYVNQYCFHPEEGTQYHCLLHFISSLGHHWITFL